jgi:hypothetical protein
LSQFIICRKPVEKSNFGVHPSSGLMRELSHTHIVVSQGRFCIVFQTGSSAIPNSSLATLAYWSYCFVVLWFMKQFQMRKNLSLSWAPWYSKRNITFSDMLAVARRSHFIPRISRDPREDHYSPKNNPARSPRDLYRLKRAKLW